MFSKQFGLFTICFVSVIFKTENASGFSFVFQLRNIEWPESLEPVPISGDRTAPLVYPNNVGQWYGTEEGIVACIKFTGAIRILVPVLLPGGSSQTFPLDIPPEAISDGRCLNSLFSLFTNTETINSISFRWQSPILDTGEMATNEFSIDFRYFHDVFGNPLYSISRFYVSFYNAQFVPGVPIKRIEQQMDNLDFFPVSTSNSFQCGQGELTARTDLFHVHFFDAHWQAFGDFFREGFKAPITTSDCASIPSDNNDDTETAEFWKVWMWSTVVTFAIAIIILGLTLFACVHCVRCCCRQNDEGYETFA